MSVQRSPPKSKLLAPKLHTVHCSSDPELNTSYDLDTSECLNITKRQKRTFYDYSEGPDSTLSEIKKMIGDLKMQQDLKFDTISSSFNTMVVQNNEIRNSLDFMSKQYDDVLNKMLYLEKENKEYKKQIQVLEDKLDIYEKNSRNSSIELRNIPKQEGEKKGNMLEVVKEIGKVVSLKPELQDFEFRDVFRIKSGTIVVNFISTVRKESYLQKFREYNKFKKSSKLPSLNTNDIKMAGQQKPIFMSESLTKKAARLFYLARELVKHKKILAAWTSYGQIYVRKEEDQPPLRIYEEKDLSKLSL